MTITYHIDESGAFDDHDGRLADADVVVAGYGMFEDARARVEREVRADAGRRWPFLPWPLHRAHLFEPTWMVLCHGAWSLKRDTAEFPTGLAGIEGGVPANSAEFHAVLDRLDPWVDEFGLGEDWHALHAWGARKRFDLSGPGAERMQFCRCADESLALARIARGDKVGNLAAPDALDWALERISSGFSISIAQARRFHEVFFPRGVPSALLTALTALQRDTLRVFEAANVEHERIVARAPIVTLAAEAAAHSACGEPDRYLALLQILIEIVARVSADDAIRLVVEGRRVERVEAEGKGRRGLNEQDLGSLCAGIAGQEWGESEVRDKVALWASLEDPSAKSRRAGTEGGEGILGAVPGSPLHSRLKDQLDHLAGWPPGLVLADFLAFELRHRLNLHGDALLRFVVEELYAKFETDGRAHAAAFPASIGTAVRPWARSTP